MKEDDIQQAANAMLVQKHQLDGSQDKLSELDIALAQFESSQTENANQLDSMLESMESLLKQNSNIATGTEYSKNLSIIEQGLDSSVDLAEAVRHLSQPKEPISLLEEVSFDPHLGWDDYFSSINCYAIQKNLDLTSDPFDSLMTESQRIDLEKRIKEDFTYKTAQCDRFDYMIAGTCGVIGGLIDILFVGLPGESSLGKFTDSAVDKSVQQFASFCGWEGQKKDGDATKSAIGFLERKFKVNYDHRHGGDVDGAFKMSTKNHHIKSLGHSPDLIGLFFSILGQFTNTAHFVDNGKLVSVDTETFELQGSNFVAKVFCGFVNWLGHLFSDVSGSSGASGRGSGIPIPFYSLLQFVDVGEFGQHKQSFATVAVQVFEKGYDFRHGLALAIPVLITELLTRITWAIKQRSYHKKPWKECIPTANNPELRRMLMVAHGSLCLVDAGDAALRSGGDMIQFLLRTNIIAWSRFGVLALKELNAWYRSGHIDPALVDKHLDDEITRLARRQH